MEYKVYPGYGLTSPTGTEEYIDAGTLASLYGLESGEYSIGSGPDDFNYINLRPRPDGKYRNIKKLLRDNGERYSYEKPAFFNKTRDGKYKNSRVIQDQYKPSFRDNDGNRTDERIL